MSGVFNQGLVLPALSVGEISFANQKQFTERVAVLLCELAFSSSPRVSPVTSTCLGCGSQHPWLPDLPESRANRAVGPHLFAP